MQRLELEQELRQCAGESQRATVDGFKVPDVGNVSELNNNSVAGSEAVSGFVALMVTQSDVRTKVSNDCQHNGLNDMHNENRFDFSTLTVKAKETPKCSLFPTSSEGSPVRRVLGEFTPTYFQASSIPMGNMGALNSVNIVDIKVRVKCHSVVTPYPN